MTHISRLVRLSVAAGAGFLMLFFSPGTSYDPLRLTTTAEARIGRPLTPMSYAGVARRTTRRAVYVGAAGAAAATGYYATGCGQQVDAYGRVYTRC
jgi:hypothetical protein